MPAILVTMPNSAPAAIKDLSLFWVTAAIQSALLANSRNAGAAKVDFCLKTINVKNVQPIVEDALMGSAILTLMLHVIKTVITVNQESAEDAEIHIISVKIPVLLVVRSAHHVTGLRHVLHAILDTI